MWKQTNQSREKGLGAESKGVEDISWLGPLSETRRPPKYLVTWRSNRDYALNVLLGCLQSSIFCVGHNTLFLASIQELFFFG
jgi:hypothetical protein